MAFRRSVYTRAGIFARPSNPSVSFVPHQDDDNKPQSLGEVPHQQTSSNLIQRRLFGSSFNGSARFGSLIQDRSCSPFSLAGSTRLGFHRHMSTTIGEASDKIDYISDAAEILSDKTVEIVASQTPAVNEVAIAAADSYFPVAALQYVIDAVHCTTGFNWWASIALTTILIRGFTVPFLINQLKATSKLSIMRPYLEEIKQEVENQGLDPVDAKKKMNRLFKEYGVTPFTPLKGLLIQGPVFVSFFLAINNMAEKVPSFKSGGAFWFTDLTTPDSLYIFPVLAALTFLINVECNVQEGMEGNPVAGTMKKFSRILAVLTVPFTMSFPKAIFCYWISSNFFSLMYGLVIKRPGMKKALGIPEIPFQPQSTAAKPAFSFSEALKKYAEQTQRAKSASTTESPKVADRKISSASVISQRLKTLEKQVKRKKKNKR